MILKNKLNLNFVLAFLTLLIWQGSCAARTQSQTPAVTAGDPTVFLPLTVRLDQPTFYVAADGSDDKGNGNDSRPWATLTHALDQVEDGSLILVKPGHYTGQVKIDRKFSEGVIVRAEAPYQAELRHDRQVIICFTCQGVTIEGFDIAHAGPGADRYVIQIQNADGTGGRNLVLRNNIIHDSHNNDLLKINNDARDITVEGNIFYNQSGEDSHIDFTSARDIVIQDNVFFNDFSGANRSVSESATGSFIVIKDVNGDDDGLVGSQNITLRRNIFLNWQGGIGNAFINLGDSSGVSYYHARNILIENNLLIGNSPVSIHAAMKIIGSEDITIRHNTVVGDLPANSFAFRLAPGGVENNRIRFYNNVWSDPTGTMGADSPGDDNRFAVTDAIGIFELSNNLYWNGGAVIPYAGNQLINYTDDPLAILGNPQINGDQTQLITPRWLADQKRFADGSTKIRQVFLGLVERFGRPGINSAAIDRADPTHAPADDILGRPRQVPDIGAYELTP